MNLSQIFPQRHPVSLLHHTSHMFFPSAQPFYPSLYHLTPVQQMNKLNMAEATPAVTTEPFKVPHQGFLSRLKGEFKGEWHGPQKQKKYFIGSPCLLFLICICVRIFRLVIPHVTMCKHSRMCDQDRIRHCRAGATPEYYKRQARLTRTATLKSLKESKKSALSPSHFKTRYVCILTVPWVTPALWFFQEEKSRQASESDLSIHRSRAVGSFFLWDIAESLMELLSVSVTPEQPVIHHHSLTAPSRKDKCPLSLKLIMFNLLLLLIYQILICF